MAHYDTGVWVVGECPQGEAAAASLGLPLLGRHRHDEAPVGCVCELGELGVDESQGGGLDGGGVERLGHVAGGVPVVGATGEDGAHGCGGDGVEAQEWRCHCASLSGFGRTGPAGRHHTMRYAALSLSSMAAVMSGQSRAMTSHG